MLLQGVFLMFMGMGVVFVFLTILVYAVEIISGLIRKFFPEEEESTEPAVSTVASNNAEIAAAVAAVQTFTKS